jgi:hypothetical protein
MNRHFDVDALVDPFTLLPPEIDFLGTNKPHNHLGKALLLKFFQAEGRFPEGEDDFPIGLAGAFEQKSTLTRVNTVLESRLS